ncbi:hypothetical protein D9758_015293 [Tetrapyrgos nigripes]|uniref:Uncharacterized protein n=1 Tax=Tetrapyrgos nigripes TaxID=182062 RepID=A0A8H5FPV7_9AGAR|nr:hypothetical protein D9758_015293 [Tetrapyrgos nigripes]
MQDTRRHSFHFRSFPSRLHSRALVAKAVDILPRDDSPSSSSSSTDPNADNGRSHKLLVVGLILGFFGVIIIGVILYWTKRMNLVERRKYMERLDEPRPTTTSPSKRRGSPSKMEAERKEGLARNGSTSSTSSQPQTQNQRVPTRQKSLGRSLSTSTRHLLRSASTSSTNLLSSSSNLLRSASSSSTNLLRSKTFAKAKESNSLAAKITPFSLTDGNYGSHTNLPGQLDDHLREGTGGGDPGAIDGYGHGPRFIHTPGENMRIASRLENGVWMFSDPKRTRGGLLGNMGNESQVSLVSGGPHVRRHTADPFSVPATPIDTDGNERGSPFADPPLTSSSSLPRQPPTAARRPTLQKAYSSNNVLDVQQAQRVEDVSRSASPSGSIYSLYDYGDGGASSSSLAGPNGNSNANVSSSPRAPPPSSFPRNININTNLPSRPSSRSSMLSVSSYTHASHSPSNAYAHGIQGIHEPLSESIPRSKPRSVSVLLEMQREERERRSRHLSRGSLGGSSVLGVSLTGGVIHGTPYAYDGDKERWDGTTEGGWTEEPDEMSDFTHSDIHSYAYSQSAYSHSETHSHTQAQTQQGMEMSEAERERERERRLREDIERYRRGEGGAALKLDTQTPSTSTFTSALTPTSGSASAFSSVFTSNAYTPTTPYTPYIPYTPNTPYTPHTASTPTSASAVPTTSLIRKPSKARVPVSVSLDLGDPTNRN